MAFERIQNHIGSENFNKFFHCKFIIKTGRSFKLRPHALRRDSVGESGKGFYFQIPFIGAIGTDGLDISLYVPYQLLAREIGFSEKSLAEINRHGAVNIVSVFVLWLLRYLNLSANALTKIEHRKMRIQLLQD